MVTEFLVMYGHLRYLVELVVRVVPIWYFTSERSNKKANGLSGEDFY
jgi:hypothetical protein